jgi:hypothetical protein
MYRRDSARVGQTGIDLMPKNLHGIYLRCYGFIDRQDEGDEEVTPAERALVRLLRLSLVMPDLFVALFQAVNAFQATGVQKDGTPLAPFLRGAIFTLTPDARLWTTCLFVGGISMLCVALWGWWTDMKFAVRSLVMGFNTLLITSMALASFANDQPWQISARFLSGGFLAFVCMVILFLQNEVKNKILESHPVRNLAGGSLQ